MSATAHPTASLFSIDVAQGLAAIPKYIPPRYLYDDLGKSLFKTIARLPEFGNADAEERILRRYSAELAELLLSVSLIAKLSEGSDRATAHLVRSLYAVNPDVKYRPLSPLAISREPVRGFPGPAEWLAGAERFSRARVGDKPIILLLPGRSLGGLESASRCSFLKRLHSGLRPGDYILLAADLIKDVTKMESAYDDALGLMAAFNKNVLTRINRELGGHFDPKLFIHSAKWNALQKRIEMRLQSGTEHDVYIAALGRRYRFTSGETIHTDSAYKLTELELGNLADTNGFRTVKTWIDIEWSFAVSLWEISPHAPDDILNDGAQRARSGR